MVRVLAALLLLAGVAAIVVLALNRYVQHDETPPAPTDEIHAPAPPGGFGNRSRLSPLEFEQDRSKPQAY